MKECEARRKFRTILRQFDLDDQVKEIEFCENELDCGALGTAEIVAEYRILLDKVLLTDPEKVESDWNGVMADFSDNVVPCLPKEDRAFLVFLHEIGHIVNRDCLEDSPKDEDEDHEREQRAWDFAWRVYRAYRAGQEQAD